MNTPDSTPGQGPAKAPVTDLDPHEPLTRESCLFVLSLLMDGRAVPAELAGRARTFAAADAECAAAWADFLAVREALAAERPRVAPADFADRVLDAAGVGGPRRAAPVLPLARRLAAAAALLLAVTLLFDVSHPGSAVADPRLESQAHLQDLFRPDPFGPLELEAGLAELLPAAAPSAPGWAPQGQRR